MRVFMYAWTCVHISRYMGFTGIVGHEFVGVVEKIEASENDDEGARLASSALLGKRVVGEINLGERQRRQKAAGALLPWLDNGGPVMAEGETAVGVPSQQKKTPVFVDVVGFWTNEPKKHRRTY